MADSAEILEVSELTHDVRRFKLQKPDGYEFTPGQATMVSIDDEAWEGEWRPFTFTSLPGNDFLELTVKIYPEKNGVTKAMGNLKPGDALVIKEPFGAIRYAGKGTFIAGGSGITPFISILRDLRSRGEIAGNFLLFANKTSADIIMKDKLEALLGKENVTHVLSREESEGADSGRIDAKYLHEKVSDIDQQFYVCGPKGFVIDISGYLKEIGAKVESITFEK